MIEERGALPEVVMVEERRHRSLEMIRQRRELFDECRVGLHVVREVPCRFIDDGSEALLATQFGDVPQLCVHLVMLGVGQIKPCREQLVRLGLFHRGEVEIVEDSRAWK